MKVFDRRRLAVSALAALLVGAPAAEAGDVVYRVVGTVPFPRDAPPRGGAGVDALDLQPKPAWVDDRYWDHLVFDLLDMPEHDTAVLRTRGLTREELAGLDIYIETPAPEADVEPISDEMVTWWQRALPDAVTRLTGRPWMGNISSGTDSRESEVEGQVNIRIGTAEEFEDRLDACAYAATSYYAFPDGSFAEWHSSEILISPGKRDAAPSTTISRATRWCTSWGTCWAVSRRRISCMRADLGSRVHPAARRPAGRADRARYPGFAADAETPACYLQDFAYDAETDEITGKVSHDGGGEATPAQTAGDRRRPACRRCARTAARPPASAG